MSPILARSQSVPLVSTKYVVSFSGIAGGRRSNVLEVHKTTHRSSFHVTDFLTAVIFVKEILLGADAEFKISNTSHSKNNLNMNNLLRRIGPRREIHSCLQFSTVHWCIFHSWGKFDLLTYVPWYYVILLADNTHSQDNSKIKIIKNLLINYSWN